MTRNTFLLRSKDLGLFQTLGRLYVCCCLARVLCSTDKICPAFGCMPRRSLLVQECERGEPLCFEAGECCMLRFQHGLGNAVHTSMQ